MQQQISRLRAAIWFDHFGEYSLKIIAHLPLCEGTGLSIETEIRVTLPNLYATHALFLHTDTCQNHTTQFVHHTCTSLVWMDHSLHRDNHNTQFVRHRKVNLTATNLYVTQTHLLAWKDITETKAVKRNCTPQFSQTHPLKSVRRTSIFYGIFLNVFRVENHCIAQFPLNNVPKLSEVSVCNFIQNKLNKMQIWYFQLLSHQVFRS